MKREEITKILDSLKPAIESITDGNVQAIINALIAIINEQQIIIDTQQNALEAQKKEIEELKEKLNTNSKNSSKSPSSERFKKKKTKKKNRSKRKQGGQPGHKGVFRELLPADEVDHIEIVALITIPPTNVNFFVTAICNK